MQIPVFTYVALGDSTGVGVGASDYRGYVVRLFERINRHRPGARLLNLCASGATSSSVNRTQLPRVPHVGTDLATLLVGANDLWFGAASATTDHLTRISTQLRERVKLTLLCTLPDMAHAPAAGLLASRARGQLAARVAAINGALRRLARRHEHVLVDLERVALAGRPHFFSLDGFHPSAQGYDALAAELWRALQLEPRFGAAQWG